MNPCVQCNLMYHLTVCKCKIKLLFTVYLMLPETVLFRNSINKSKYSVFPLLLILTFGSCLLPGHLLVAMAIVSTTTHSKYERNFVC